MWQCLVLGAADTMVRSFGLMAVANVVAKWHLHTGIVLLLLLLLPPPQVPPGVNVLVETQRSSAAARSGNSKWHCSASSGSTAVTTRATRPLSMSGSATAAPASVPAIAAGAAVASLAASPTRPTSLPSLRKQASDAAGTAWRDSLKVCVGVQVCRLLLTTSR